MSKKKRRQRTVDEVLVFVAPILAGTASRTALTDAHVEEAVAAVALAMNRISEWVALHDLNLAAHYTDRIALMVAWNIKAVGKPAEVLKPELIADAYCLSVQVVKHPFLDVPLVLPQTK